MCSQLELRVCWAMQCTQTVTLVWSGCCVSFDDTRALVALQACAFVLLAACWMQLHVLPCLVLPSSHLLSVIGPSDAIVVITQCSTRLVTCVVITLVVRLLTHLTRRNAGHSRCICSWHTTTRHCARGAVRSVVVAQQSLSDHSRDACCAACMSLWCYMHEAFLTLFDRARSHVQRAV